MVCSCGNQFFVGSTVETTELRVEICSACHPFFTGEQKIVDTQGNVEKYIRRKEVSERKMREVEELKKRRAEKEKEREEKRKKRLADEIGVKDIYSMLTSQDVKQNNDALLE